MLRSEDIADGQMGRPKQQKEIETPIRGLVLFGLRDQYGRRPPLKMTTISLCQNCGH